MCRYPPYVFVPPEMVGYVSKDEGKSHFRTHAKNVSRPDINEALAEYRALQRAVVTEYRTEVGKKNIFALLRRYKVENFQGVEVSVLQLMTWYIQAGLGMPSPTWVTPSGGWPMCPMRADAYMLALMTPELFTRKHCYSLFFSGGQGARSTLSFEKWDIMDREFAGMTHDQAKECSHKRMLLEGRLDQARAKAALEKVAAKLSTGAVPRLCQDSSDSEGEQAEEQSSRPDETARRSINDLVRSDNDLSEESEHLPVVVHPKCVGMGCTRAGTYGMVSCSMCEGALHRSCGVMANEDGSGDVGYQGMRCKACAQPRNGKGKSKGS